jgi:hypothetical protein
MTAMTTTSRIDEAERARRTEMARDLRAACAQGETLEVRAKKREEKADEWARWFKQNMAAAGCTDPGQILPDALARLEQVTNDRIVAAVHELKSAMRGALK